MRTICFMLVLVLSSVPLSLRGQLELPAVVTSNVPDFGATPGTWGHLQFSRPFGVKGIMLEEWVDMTAVHPLNGEYFNTDRQGWFPLETGRSPWSQMHPILTAPADTIAPSLLANYKQGEGDFQDFSLWYHNSLGKSTRYAWVSKLRSHQRVLAVTPYDQQSHRLQIQSELDEQLIRAEMGYTHQVNPLYVSEFDTSSLMQTYNDKLVIRSDRWNGYFQWQSHDSNSSGSEVFVQVQGGIWNLGKGQVNSFDSFAYLRHRIKLGSWTPLEFKLGLISKQFGVDRTVRHFFEVNLPGLSWNKLHADLGLKNLGMWRFFPTIDVQIEAGPLVGVYATRQLIDDRTRNPDFQMATIHHFRSILNYSNIKLLAGAWRGRKSGEIVSGYEGHAEIRFPWSMNFTMGMSFVDQTPDWVWSKKQVSWELDQDLILFDQALAANLKIWGRHLLQPQVGFLDPELLQVLPGSDAGSNSILHLLNYTIQVQISTLIIGFTDSNILQDDLWAGVVNVPWNSTFTLMTNQLPESRFRYLSVIWVFDN